MLVREAESSRRDLLIRTYLDSWKPFTGRGVARQAMEPEEIDSYFVNDEFRKIEICEGDGKPLGILFLTQNPSLSTFFNPDFFESRVLRNFVVRGGVGLDRDLLMRPGAVLEGLAEYGLRELVIDRALNGAPDPLSIFPKGNELDLMRVWSWHRSDCFLELNLAEGKVIEVRETIDPEGHLAREIWQTFQEGFDNLEMSPCPQLFDLGLFQELCSIPDVQKILCWQGTELIGAAISLPTCLVPYADQKGLANIADGKKTFFVLDMTIKKTYRSVANFRDLARGVVLNLPEGSIVIMDHSERLNPSFPASIRRVFRLSPTQLHSLGIQSYEEVSW